MRRVHRLDCGYQATLELLKVTVLQFIFSVYVAEFDLSIAVVRGTPECLRGRDASRDPTESET